MDTKICNCCKEELPIDCFYFKDKEHKVLRGKCKKCVIKQKSEYEKNLTGDKKIRRKESKQKSYLKNKDSYNKKTRERRHNHLEECRIKKNKYREKYKGSGRCQAWHTTQYIVRKFNLRPSICSICLQKGIIHAHHIDYKEPSKIIFVCNECHMKIHSGVISIDENKIIDLNNIHIIREHKIYSTTTW